MDVNLEKGTITIFGKPEKLDALVNKLSSLSGEQVYSLFDGRGIALPRKMNCMALTSVINKRLKTLHASELSKDYFMRLAHYKNFSEIQLFNLYMSICNTKEYFKEYRQNLFRLILINFVGLNLTDGEINYLKGIKKLPVERFEDYYQYISSMCQEQDNTFDGQELSQLQDVLCNASPNQEIVDLGEKYGIAIPTALKKNELVDFMKEYLINQGELTRNLEVEIEASSVAGLNNLCKKYRIPMSSNMNKQELVSYLFYYLSQCEVDTTSVRRIESLPMYEPLEFTVDLTVFKGFVPDDTRRIIRYDGDEEEEFLSINGEDVGYIIVNTDEEASNAEELTDVKEAPYNDNEVNENPSNLEEAIAPQSNDAVSEEVSAKEENEESPYVDENGKALNIDQIEAMINGEEIPEAKEEPKEEPEEIKKEELAKNALPMNDVRENDQYGNEKLKRLTRGAGAIVGWATIGTLAALAIGAIIFMFI
ncbi:MAG: hypothetical protein E7176_04410 [Erysipelotrichaceae bacterium]|nr:hypothetical protein [Erysipelotrichaceae bacterium]